MRGLKLFGWGILIFMLSGWGQAYGADNKLKARVLVDKSQIVLKEFANVNSEGNPEWMLRNCHGVAIFPNMFKGGFFLGGAYGRGIVMRYKDGKWLGPSFISIGSGSIGLQFGLQAVDLILVVLGDKTMDAFLKSKFKLGADAAIAAGPVGAHTTMATEIKLRGGVYSFSRTKGAFIGFSLEGAGIMTEYGLNEAYYQTTSSPQTILSEEVVQPPSAVEVVEFLGQFR